MRLLKILLILLLIAFPFGELLRFDIGNNIRFKPLDVLSGLMMLVWFYLFITRQIKFQKVHWIYLVFPIVCLVSLVINSYWLQPNELAAAGLYLLRWLSYLSIYFVVLQFDGQFIKKILSILLLDGLIIVLLGFLQFFFFNNLKPLYFLGWDDHMYRLFSVFLDPNFTGAYIALYIIFVGGLLYKVSKEKNLKSNQSIITLPFTLSNQNLRAILTGIISLAAIAMFLTFSRSTILMFLFSASIFSILIGRKRLILVLFGFILLFTVLISSRFYIENVNLFRQASTSARLSNYQIAFSMFINDPLFGVGFNAYRYAKEKHNIQMGWSKSPSHADAGNDNSFLFILATTGIVGFVAFMALVYTILKRALFLHRKKSTVFAVVLIASVSGLLLNSMFINSLFFPAIMVWVWLINGIMERTSH